MFPHAKPAALDAAGRISFRLGLSFFFDDFLASELRSVVSMGFRRSGLELRDEFDLTRKAGELVADAPAPAAAFASSFDADS
jgi:hypothetical protein